MTFSFRFPKIGAVVAAGLLVSTLGIAVPANASDTVKTALPRQPGRHLPA